MEVEGAVALDDKAKRMRDLLSSFYSPDQSSSASLPSNTSSRFATLDTINTASFDADQYMNLLVRFQFPSWFIALRYSLFILFFKIF